MSWAESGSRQFIVGQGPRSITYLSASTICGHALTPPRWARAYTSRNVPLTLHFYPDGGFVPGKRRNLERQSLCTY